MKLTLNIIMLDDNGSLIGDNDVFGFQAAY